MINSNSKTIHYCIALLFFVMMPAFSAETKPWDGQAALKLSDQLYSASRKLNTECRASPKYTGSMSTDSSGHLEFRYHVRHFMSVTRELSESLESGADKAQTQPIYNESVKIMGDLKKYAGGLQPTAWPLVVNAISDAEAIQHQLGAYYSQE